MFRSLFNHNRKAADISLSVEPRCDLILELPSFCAVSFFPGMLAILDGDAEQEGRFTFTINAFFERSLELLTGSKEPGAFLINK